MPWALYHGLSGIDHRRERAYGQSWFRLALVGDQMNLAGLRMVVIIYRRDLLYDI